MASWTSVIEPQAAYTTNCDKFSSFTLSVFAKHLQTTLQATSIPGPSFMLYLA